MKVPEKSEYKIDPYINILQVSHRHIKAGCDAPIFLGMVYLFEYIGSSMHFQGEILISAKENDETMNDDQLSEYILSRLKQDLYE